MELISILSSPINSKLTLTMKKLFVTIALALTLSGCSLFPSNWGK
ncbi:lipoprotein [Vibrio fluvialis]|nr:lipoprotein [Vibrio fluvialis]